MILPSLTAGSQQQLFTNYPPGSFGAQGVFGCGPANPNNTRKMKFYRNLVNQGLIYTDNINGSTSFAGTLDANGFPATAPSGVASQFVAGIPDWPNGDYQCCITLPGTTGVETFTSIVSIVLVAGSIVNVAYQGSSTWNFTWRLTGAIDGVGLSAVVKVTQAFNNLQIMWPQYVGWNGKTYGPYSVNDPNLFCEEAIDRYKNFAVLRGMQWLIANESEQNIAYGVNWNRSIYTGSLSGTTAGSTITVTLPGNSAYGTPSSYTFDIKNAAGANVASHSQASNVYTITAADVTAAGGLAIGTGSNGRPDQAALLDETNRPTTATRLYRIERCHEDWIAFVNAVAAAPNSLVRAVWVNMRNWASNTYHTTVATLYKNTLNPKVAVYLELSNEPWNATFTQYRWFAAYANTPGAFNPDQGFAKRYAEIVPLWRTVFGESGTLTSANRLKPIFGVQTVNPTALSALNTYATANSVALNTIVYGVCGEFYTGDFNLTYTITSTGAQGLPTAAQIALDISSIWYQHVNGNTNIPGAFQTRVTQWRNLYTNVQSLMYAGCLLVGYEGSVSPLSNTSAASAQALLECSAWFDPSSVLPARDHVFKAVQAGFSEVLCFLSGEEILQDVRQWNWYRNNREPTYVAAAYRGLWYEQVPARVP